MQSHKSFVLPVIAMLLAYPPADAQSKSYHVEVVDASGGLKRTYVVNDSDKTIEAVHFSARCEPAHDTAHWFFRDVLSSSSQTVGLKPSGRLQVLGFSAEENSSCAVHVDAVLFADGTHDGNDSGLRAIQAHRDGVFVVLKYWSARLAKEGPETFDLASCNADAKRRSDEASTRFASLHKSGEEQPVGDAYREGRLNGEMNVFTEVIQLPHGKTATYDFHRLSDLVMAWMNRFDNDPSASTLSAEFVTGIGEP